MSDSSGNVIPLHIRSLTETNTDNWPAPPAATRVLTVCRDAAALQWATKWLTHAGLTSLLASSAEHALALCADQAPDIVIAESGLCADDGRDLLNMLCRERIYGNIPVIVLAQTPKETKEALDAGAIDVVRKPVDWNLVSRRTTLIAGAICMASELDDTRAALRSAESQVEFARRHLSELGDADPLTGLPNLSKFRELLARALAQGGELALFCVGLERFHLINEALSRDNGDRVLSLVGDRLRESLVRPELHAIGSHSFLAGCVAKLDGVRFGLFVPHNGQTEHLQTIRAVLTEVLAQPLEIDGRTLYLSSSIGGAVAPRDGLNARQLLQNAERAMMTVKRRGGGFGFHHDSSSQSSSRMLDLDRALREAVANEDLQVAYQPLVNLWNNRIVGAEALLRWNRKPHGNVSPAEFVPMAERNGTVVQLGDFVIDTACRELRRWHDAGKTGMRMAINLSLIQLRRGDVKRSVQRAVETYDLQPEHLEFEISERGAICNDQGVVRQLHELKALGVRLSLDDFGTGDTAIEYLKRLPIDVLKLDRSYVAGALENGIDAVIASALVGLAKNMNLTVIAEGVESVEQYELLRTWGCHLYQGFYCSPAVFGDAFLELLEAQSQDRAQEFGP